MDYQLRDDIINRIISGKLRIVDNQKYYIVHHPARDIRVCASKIYFDTLKNCRFDMWLNDYQVLQILIKNGLWTNDDNLKEIRKTIEKLQIELYKSLLNPLQCKQIRDRLQKVKKKEFEMYETRHSLDYVTAVGFATMVKNQFLFMSTITDEENNLIDLNNYGLFKKLYNIAVDNVINIATYRELARTEPWRSYWNICKGNPFGKAVADWTEDQRVLVMFSKMYDNIYKHTECPPDNVIEDDDQLDGWLLLVKEEREKDKQKQRGEKVVSRLKNEKAGEIFIPVQSDVEANEIDKLNTFEAKRIKQQRMKKILSDKVVSESNLPDIRNKIYMESQRLARDKIKSRGR